MVEWKTIGDILAVHTGKQLNRSGLSEVGAYPVINGGRTPSGYSDSHNENKNSITISQGGESAGFVNWIDTAFWAGSHCYVVENINNQNLRFLFHLLKNYEYEIMESKQGAGIPGLNRKNLYSILVPIPSVSEQNRIVGILDTFTDSIENLKQQIAQRRKQFEFYRDHLLDLEGKEGVELTKLGEIAYYSKDRISALMLNAKNYVSVENLLKDKAGRNDSEKVPESGNWVGYKENDILIGNIRPYLRKIWLADRDGGTNGDVLVIRPKKEIAFKFLYFVLSSEIFFDYYNMTAKGGKMPRGDKKRALSYPIFLPTLSEQQRIVSILNTFEASISNLEAQLAQRQKQYEYYRNKLLTFE